jgi:chromosomal replication initiator protein
MNLSDEVVEYIAYNITHTIRDLEGALVTLLAKSYSENKEISLSIAKEILTDLVGVEAKQLTIPTIKKLVSAELKISIEDMEGKSRKREIVQARQIAMHLANHYTTCSLKTVGSYFGNRDHSTVIHSCRTVEDIIATDKRFKSMVDMLHNKIKVGSV